MKLHRTKATFLRSGIVLNGFLTLQCFCLVVLNVVVVVEPIGEQFKFDLGGAATRALGPSSNKTLCKAYSNEAKPP